MDDTPFRDAAIKFLPQVKAVAPKAFVDWQPGDVPCIRLPDGASIVCDPHDGRYDLWTPPTVKKNTAVLGYTPGLKNGDGSAAEALAFAAKHGKPKPYHPGSNITDVPVEVADRGVAVVERWLGGKR